MRRDDLMPCPFCGSTTATVFRPTCDRTSPYDPSDRAFPIVRCMTCYTEVAGQDFDASCQSARDKWNRRPSLSAALSEQTQPATGWLSIETAPRDGTNILVWAEGYSWPEVVRYVQYDDPHLEEETGEPGYWRYSDDVFADILQIEEGEFTHWRPLPVPPTTRIADSAEAGGSATSSSGGEA